MFSVYTILSLRHLRRHWIRALLIVASIALGVGALVGTRCLDRTMSQAALHAANPLAGTADLIVSNGEGAPIDRRLQTELSKVPGVKVVRPRIFENVTLPDLDNRPALLVGLDQREMLEKNQESGPFEYSANIPQKAFAALYAGKTPVVIGKELDNALPGGVVRVQPPWHPQNLGPAEAARSAGMVGAAWGPLLAGSALVSGLVQRPFELTRCGTVDARGPAAALGGSILILDLGSAAKIVGRNPDLVSRLDVLLDPGSDQEQVRRQLEQVLAGRGLVRTPEEQDQVASSAMSGIQMGFALGGLAALLVGLFLIYNVLSVTVAERRHEIGVLLGVGATPNQIRWLFAGEAALLGLIGSALGIPLGLAMAYVGLQPVQNVLRELIATVPTDHLEIGLDVLVLALLAGELTAIAAALIPASSASREKPAEAVRRIPPPPSARRHVAQLAASSLLGGIGLACMFWRKELPSRLGTFGGIGLLLLSALLITPHVAGLLARLVQPITRRWAGVATRLAADNLVRAPGRTGLVIAALAAGVALVLQTAGTIRSNREALNDWVRDYLPADLFITSGSPVGAASQSKPMEVSLGQEIARLPGVEAALPLRYLKVDFRENVVFLNAIDAEGLYRANRSRAVPEATVQLYRQLGERPGTAIVSESFTALYGVDRGSVITLVSLHGPVTLEVIGKLPDYKWHRGSIFINRGDCLKHWGDGAVDEFEVYLRPGQNVQTMQETILRKLGPSYGLFALTRAELTQRIDGVVEGLHGIAYAQQLVVMLVAGLGVVMALLISVLQRRHEMGLLRAIGASRFQVICSVLAEAALMGVIGTVIGLALGLALLWTVLNVVILEESGFLFPLRMPWLEGLAIAGAALLLASLAGLWPALVTVRQRIPEAIAYE